MTGIRVAIFEDNLLVREGMQAILNGTEGYSCCGAYSDANQVLQKVRSCQPDVVMMDIEMPGLSGIEATASLHEAFPEIRVLIQTVFHDSDKIFRALCAGASGYILKNESPARQIEAIHEVYHGGAPMSPSIAKKIMQFFLQKNIILISPDTTDYQLSEREKEILSLIVQGIQLKAIADRLFISYETVRTHVKKIYKKLHVASRAEAVLKARQQGLV